MTAGTVPNSTGTDPQFNRSVPTTGRMTWGPAAASGKYGVVSPEGLAVKSVSDVACAEPLATLGTEEFDSCPAPRRGHSLNAWSTKSWPLAFRPRLGPLPGYPTGPSRRQSSSDRWPPSRRLWTYRGG